MPDPVTVDSPPIKRRIGPITATLAVVANMVGAGVNHSGSGRTVPGAIR